jgi:ATP-binding cassette, subfamily B, bacterial CvaB/MchF/RaxB
MESCLTHREDMQTQLQSEAAECGLACLVMVASAHGLRLDLADLRRRFAVGLKGVSLRQLMAYSAALNFSPRAVRLDLNGLSRLQQPCILHWDLNHFVVLKQAGRRHVVVIDPAVGERHLSINEVSHHFTGVALELSPNAQFAPHDTRPKFSLAALTGAVHGLPRALAAILAVALVLEVFAITAPLFSQLVVDEAITAHDADLLTVLVLGFGLLLLAQSALGLARSWMLMVLGQTLSLQWYGNVFAHLIRLPVHWFEQRHLGDITSRFGAVSAIQRTLTAAAIESILDGVMAVAAFAMMWLYAPLLAGVVLTAVALYAVLRWASYRPLRVAAAERLVVAARENSHFLESLRAIQPLKLFGREEERRGRWQNLIVDVQNLDVRAAKLNIGFSTASTLIFGVENLAVFWLGAKRVMDGQTSVADPFTIGMLFSFVAYKTQFTGRVSALINYAVELKMLRLHAERLADIVLTAPERDGPEGLLPEHDLAHLSPSLELRNVSFRYAEGEPWLLRHACLTVPAGQSVAIVGPSGTGKTTLLKITLGILAPTEGEVLYGGVPIRQLGLANVRRRIGTVMQEDLMLTGSLADNITFFDTQPDASRIEASGRMAQVHDEIVRMPMGYRTLVGDLGSGLSGGQKQRILLARALYKRPSVLALDEATSHLDVACERAVTRALSQLSLTRLVIAHRPETIAGVDRVVQLTGGAIEPCPLFEDQQ